MSGPLRLAEEAAPVFRFGEFTFDCQSHLLTRNGAEQRLSPKAQLLLRVLLLARPRALSREELYDVLWPSTFVCETNLATVVNEVRRALDDRAQKPRYIRTVHGYGYAFKDLQQPTVAAELLLESRRYTLAEGDNLIGRAPDAQVVFQHRSVSRRHAVIHVHDGELSIRDLGSTNGTKVEGRPVGSSPVPLKPPSEIEIGGLVVKVIARKSSSTTKLHVTSKLRQQIAERMPQA